MAYLPNLLWEEGLPTTLTAKPRKLDGCGAFLKP